MSPKTTIIRDLRDDDLEDVVRLDFLHTGKKKRAWWQKIVVAYSTFTGDEGERVALIAEDADGKTTGYLFGEVRAWEFGSDRCGWIFAVGADPKCARAGVATELCETAIKRFRKMGVDVVRTMVRRDDVPVLSFFRSMGFAAGPFAEMERPVREDSEERT